MRPSRAAWLPAATAAAAAGAWLARHRASPAVQAWRPGGGRRLRAGPLAVRVIGDDGPATVLLHGLTGSGDWWGADFDRLADGGRLVIPDLLGFGASMDLERTDFSLDARRRARRDGGRARDRRGAAGRRRALHGVGARAAVGGAPRQHHAYCHLLRPAVRRRGRGARAHRAHGSPGEAVRAREPARGAHVRAHVPVPLVGAVARRRDLAGMAGGAEPRWGPAHVAVLPGGHERHHPQGSVAPGARHARRARRAGRARRRRARPRAGHRTVRGSGA
jgi:hypothetical protein